MELDESDNVEREIRRLCMRLDTLTPAPGKWPENVEQVSKAFGNKTGSELMGAIAYSLEWVSSPTWITRSARLILANLAKEKT